jgi:starch-binding outer membrane protein, SusD/RagB family
MKNIISKYIIVGSVLGGIFSGCSEEFLERPPAGSIVDGSFYKTDEQVLAGTALLYNQAWFDYNDKASYNLGDFRAGTAYSAWNDRNNVEFNTTGATPENSTAWRSFFIVVGQANLAIYNINNYGGAAVTPALKNHVLAEARFMRATAYQHLVMNWGPVPIIENNFDLLLDSSKSRNTEESVWEFITRDLIYAKNNLMEQAPAVGRINKWSAEGMLARTYLIRSGVGASVGTRNQTYLDSAKYYSDRVINLSGASLLSDYADLYTFPYDNNSESLFSLQWVFSTGWGTQNSAPAYLAYSGDIANGDGWGGDKSATLWMLGLYEGLTTTGRTLDQRLKATFMLPGMRYPEISQTAYDPTSGAITGNQELLFPQVGSSDGDVNFASIKKYVTGKNGDGGQVCTSQRYGHDTYMLRLAEMYLIYAEATLGNGASTSDAKALEYFNAVHRRAGLGEFPAPLSFEDIFKEKIIEFAMEGRAWYDFVALHYHNPDLAYTWLKEQDRGAFYVEVDNIDQATSWTFAPTSWVDVATRKIDANSGNFRLPIPDAEVSQAPNLRKPAVDYDFGN